MLNFFRNSSILSVCASSVSKLAAQPKQGGLAVKPFLRLPEGETPGLRPLSTIMLCRSLSSFQPSNQQTSGTSILSGGGCSPLCAIRGPIFPLPGVSYMQVRGMKWKGKVKRRCKDCFLMMINGTLYNLCKTHPRHKHGLKQPYFTNQRILTHATQCAKRPW